MKNYNKGTSLFRLLADSAVPVTQTTLSRCIATLRRYVKNMNKRGSQVDLAMWRPSSWRKSSADSSKEKENNYLALSTSWPSLRG